MPDMADIAGRLLHPAVQALSLGVLCIALVIARRERLALLAAVLAIAWIGLASAPGIALRLQKGLAGTAPAHVAPADAIVVLGGGKLPDVDWAGSTTRAGMGLTLWRMGLAPVVLLSGSDQADELAHGFASSGVPRRDLRIEDTSRNTHENARNAAAILKADGRTNVVLVTSAIHMRRAAGCFRREGIAVSPAPVDDGVAALAQAPSWLPRRDALTLTARCLREYAARWIYEKRGWL